ncbi:MAG: polyamine aminopropyltransferase [Gammaproteobacteria bacterium]|nr:polyamine aminopropyltransferase [Gammaproteobacteria bacterium]
MKNQFEETLYDAHGQIFSVEDIYFEDKSEHQHIIIFHNSKFGRVMALDGIVQTTEKDEFFYHEMLTHVPIYAHGAAENILIIGGGDGGMLRETLRHSTVKTVTMVEIDQSVINMCIKYLPRHSQGAFDDPRLNLVIADGARFVTETSDKYDVIIVDSTDPIGPGEVLFQMPFYQNCHDILKDNGIIVTQNGVAFMQLDEIKNTHQYFSRIFLDHTFYFAAVPTYVGGDMAFGWGTNHAQHRKTGLETLKERYEKSAINTRYYNPDIHLGCFALPQYIVDLTSSLTS